MVETKRTGIIDKEGGNILANVVESTASPGTYGLVALNPDGSDIGGGGAASIVIGNPVTGANPGRILYVDAAGNLFGDDSAIRDSGIQKQTTIGSLTYAQGNANDGSSSEAFFQADNIGDTGNSIALVFDGVDDVDTVVNAWNAANPGNTVSIIGGSGTVVPTAETVTLIGGGEVNYESGTINNVISPDLQGAGVSLTDATNNFTGFSFTGNLTTITGDESLGFVAAGIDGNTGDLGALVVGNIGINFFLTDQATYNATIGGSSQDVFISYNGTKFTVDSSAGPLWEDNTNNRYILPVGVNPAIGDVLTVDSIAGTDYNLEFVTPASGGNTFQLTLTEDMTSYIGAIVALNVEAGGPTDYQGSPLFKTTTQNNTATGIGPSQLFCKSLKLNQQVNMIASQSSTQISIQGMHYDVITGTWGSSWSGIAIGDTINTAIPFDWCRVDNNHFVVGYVNTSDNLIFVSYRGTNLDIEIINTWTIPAGSTYNSIKMAESGGGVSFLAERTDIGFIERGNILFHADGSIRDVDVFTTAIVVGANSANFQMKGCEWNNPSVLLYCEPVSGDMYIIDSTGGVVCSNSSGTFNTSTSLSIMSLGNLDPSNLGWALFWNNTTTDSFIATVVYNISGATVGQTATSMVFATSATMNTSLYSASVTGFINETTSTISQPSVIFAQRMNNTVDCQLASISVSYAIPLVPAYTVANTDTVTIANFDDTIGAMSANNWRFESLQNRNQYLLSLDYISNSAGATPQRLIHVYDNDGAGTFTNETRRKADFSTAGALIIPNGGYTAGAVVTAYGPGAIIPVTGGNNVMYIGSDGLSVETVVSDIIAYEQVTPTTAIVRLLPYAPKELDGYPGSAYPTEGYSLYKLFDNANSVNPQISNPGYLTNDIKIVNMVAGTNQIITIQNVNNTGVSLQTVTGPGYLINKNDYIIVKPRIDFCDGGFDIIEDGRTRFQLQVDMTDLTYFDNNTLYLPYFWKNYGQVQLENTTGTSIQFIRVDGSPGLDSRLFLQPDDSAVNIIQTTVATPTAYAIFGLNTTTNLSSHSATYYGDWIELDYKNNARHKYNIEIYT